MISKKYIILTVFVVVILLGLVFIQYQRFAIARDFEEIVVSVDSSVETMTLLQNNQNIVTIYLLLEIFAICLIIIYVGCLLRVILKQEKLSIARNRFIDNITHELKTPISTISLASQMLLVDKTKKSTISLEHIAAIVKEESQRLTYLTIQILKTTTILGRSKLKLKNEEIDIHQLLDKCIRHYKLQIVEKQGVIRSRFDAKNVILFIDESLIFNAISNLIDNAIKYSKPGLEIDIVTKNNDKNIIISVIDNGIGIPIKEQKMVFERFHRGKEVQDTIKGFGLGLAYVKSIINAHKGKIFLKSKEGVGSKFDIILPLLYDIDKNI